ncbi:hypothetical protein GCM10011529_29360 [Polymorphobacter glacialis]|uniref:Uncharacterized protein n=1 Tax=Sandarakinorhabdus glacialis TaxID=1614636 RepID=A0A917EBA7_9SPHN|nr:hypothetical protein GCM10011529_29360 [Polymorphobacter glacialis]
MCCFETAGAGADGTGKGAGFVAEHLAFEKVGGYCGAIQGDKGLGSAAAALMQQLCDYILARARWTSDQHRRVCIGDLFDFRSDGCHNGSIANEMRECGTIKVAD